MSREVDLRDALAPAGETGPVEILLIDDNEDYLLLIRRALEGHDPRYRVTGVSSPEEAYRLLDEHPYQLVLLDYKFPRGNGLQVIRTLKGKATFVPTVMVTAFGDESLAIQAMREGALDFVPKTRDFIEALPEVVSRAIERGRIIRERIRAREVLERQNRELSLLSELAGSLNAERDPRRMLRTTARRLGSFVGAVRAQAWLCSAEGVLERVDHRAAGEEDSLSERALLRRAVRSRDIVSESATDGGGDRLVVPLVSKENAVGALVFELGGGAAVTDAERTLAVSLGKQVGVAVEHALLHAELVSTQGYLQDLVENAADEVVTIDRDARIRTWNAGAEATYGWSRDAVVGRPWDLLWDAERRHEADELARRVLVLGETVRNHATVRVSRDGSPMDILLTLSPLRDPDGSVGGVSCLGKNVTLERQLQAQLVQSEKMAAVGQLISGVAHELNNPLTGVLGYAQLVSSVDTGEKLTGYLEKIATEASRCQRIVQNLLTFARKHEPRATRIDLNTVVRETLELRRYDLRVNDVELVEDLAADLPSTLADVHQLQQVFINIITNAQHALTKRDGPGRLVISTRCEPGADGRGGELLVAFDDDGPGIPAGLREKVFDPFFTTKEVGEGTGLGLSLSYGIVQEHGGRIQVVESELGGARFELRLPILPELRAVERVQASKGQEQEEGPPALDPKRILVVDDQPSIREILVDILSKDGHRIDTAADGWEALEMIQGRDSYDLIIVDLKMPRLGGDRLFERLASEQPELARRVVFATGDVVSSETRRFLERSGSRLLPKPFGVDDIRSTVSSFFREAQ